MVYSKKRYFFDAPRSAIPHRGEHEPNENRKNYPARHGGGTFTCLCLLVACNVPGSSSSSETATGETGSATDDSGTATATSRLNEDVTAPVRYDYLSADVSADVDIEPSDYSDMKLTLPASLRVTDEDAMEYIKQTILFEYRVADNGTEKMTDKKMKKGDSAFIYYKGEIDGKEFSGGSNWDDKTPYELKLGSGSFIPGFEDGLIDVIPALTSKESPVTVKATFPQDYGKEELNGKEATFLRGGGVCRSVHPAGVQPGVCGEDAEVHRQEGRVYQRCGVPAGVHRLYPPAAGVQNCRPGVVRQDRRAVDIPDRQGGLPEPAAVRD